MRGPGIFSFKVLESPGKVLEFCSVISVATLKVAMIPPQVLWGPSIKYVTLKGEGVWKVWQFVTGEGG